MTALDATAADAPHIPVLVDEVIDALAILPGERHVDATFGAGGYTRAMLAKGATVFAFDRDPDAIREGETLVRDGEGRLALIELLRMDPTLDELVANHAPLHEIRRAAFEHGYHPLAEDGIKRVLDGVTSLSEVSRVVDLTGRV